MRSIFGMRCCLSLIVLFLVVPAHADDQMLVLTAEEFDANLDYRERDANILPKPIEATAPQIVVEAPNIGADVAPPIDVLVRFQPSEDASIDVDSLQVRYGWFDITKRVRDSMTVTPDGIVGKLRSMRHGKYTLRVSISDTKKRRSSAEIRFTIADSFPQARNSP